MRIELRYCQIPICKLPADYDDLPVLDISHHRYLPKEDESTHHIVHGACEKGLEPENQNQNTMKLRRIAD